MGIHLTVGKPCTCCTPPTEGMKIWWTTFLLCVVGHFIAVDLSEASDISLMCTVRHCACKHQRCCMWTCLSKSCHAWTTGCQICPDHVFYLNNCITLVSERRLTYSFLNNVEIKYINQDVSLNFTKYFRVSADCAVWALFFSEHLWVLFPDVFIVVTSEVAVDIIKHAFITKFNDITADVRSKP